MLKPSALQFQAASAHCAAVRSISSTLISSTCTPSSRSMAEGPTGFLRPGMASGWFMAPTWLSWTEATAPWALMASVRVIMDSMWKVDMGLVHTSRPCSCRQAYSWSMKDSVTVTSAKPPRALVSYTSMPSGVG